MFPRGRKETMTKTRFPCPNQKKMFRLGSVLLGLCRVQRKKVIFVPCPTQSAFVELPVAKTKKKKREKFTFSSVGCGGEEGGDTCTAGTDTLGKSALGSQLDLKLAREVLTLKLLVLTDITADHTLDLNKEREKNTRVELVCMLVLQ